jgi:hypothetical protein
VAVYFDGTHLASPDVRELHEFAQKVGIKRCWLEGTRRGHPHYDITNREVAGRVVEAGAVKLSSKELVRKCFRRSS